MQFQQTHENRHMLLSVGVGNGLLLNEMMNHHLAVIVHLCRLQKESKFSNSRCPRQMVEQVVCEVARVGRNTFHKDNEQH
jgi:hypothetical protein